MKIYVRASKKNRRFPVTAAYYEEYTVTYPDGTVEVFDDRDDDRPIQEKVAELHPEYSDLMHHFYPGLTAKHRLVQYDDPIEDCRSFMKRNMTYNSTEDKIVDKIINAISSGKINENNYWDEIRKMTARITSDKSIKTWQRFSEYIFDQIFG